jgi:hypothetical protein
MLWRSCRCQKQFDLPGEREYMIVVVFEFLYFLSKMGKGKGRGPAQVASVGWVSWPDDPAKAKRSEATRSKSNTAQPGWGPHGRLWSRTEKRREDDRASCSASAAPLLSSPSPCVVPFNFNAARRDREPSSSRILASFPLPPGRHQPRRRPVRRPPLRPRRRCPLIDWLVGGWVRFVSFVVYAQADWFPCSSSTIDMDGQSHPWSLLTN